MSLRSGSEGLFPSLRLVGVPDRFITPVSVFTAVIHPDELDRKIMRELESPGSLRWNVRESYSSIAKRLGVDEETVRKRVLKVRQSGVLQGWELVINPHLVGRESASIELSVQTASKESAISELRLVDGVVSILSFHGAGLQVGFYYRSEKGMGRQVRLMEAVCGCKGTMLWKVTFPSFDLEMRPTDWLILDALRRDPRTRLSELAGSLNLSTRTLSRRLDRMVAGYAFFLHASIDVKKLGGLACRLLLYCRDQEKKRAVDDAIIARFDKIEWLYTVSEEYSMFVMHCENTAEAEEMESWVKGQEGVDEVRVDVIEEQVTVQEWLGEEIETRSQQAR